MPNENAFVCYVYPENSDRDNGKSMQHILRALLKNRMTKTEVC